MEKKKSVEKENLRHKSHHPSAPCFLYTSHTQRMWKSVSITNESIRGHQAPPRGEYSSCLGLPLLRNQQLQTPTAETWDGSKLVLPVWKESLLVPLQANKWVWGLQIAYNLSPLLLDIKSNNTHVMSNNSGDGSVVQT